MDSESFFGLNENGINVMLPAIPSFPFILPWMGEFNFADFRLVVPRNDLQNYEALTKNGKRQKVYLKPKPDKNGFSFCFPVLDII